MRPGNKLAAEAVEWGAGMGGNVGKAAKAGEIPDSDPAPNPCDPGAMTDGPGNGGKGCAGKNGGVTENCGAGVKEAAGWDNMAGAGPEGAKKV